MPFAPNARSKGHRPKTFGAGSRSRQEQEESGFSEDHDPIGVLRTRREFGGILYPNYLDYNKEPPKRFPKPCSNHFGPYVTPVWSVASREFRGVKLEAGEVLSHLLHRSCRYTSKAHFRLHQGNIECVNPMLYTFSSPLSDSALHVLPIPFRVNRRKASAFVHISVNICQRMSLYTCACRLQLNVL